VSIDTDRLIQECVNKLDTTPFPEPQIVLSRGKFVISEYTISLESVSGDKATILVSIRDSDGGSNQGIGIPNTHELKVRGDLGKLYPILRGFKILEILDRGENSIVKFSDKAQTELTKYKPITVTSEKGQVHSDRTIETIQDTYPVFNLIDRAAKETNLTRSTLNKIFQGMEVEQKSVVLRNPEGFASTFITAIKLVVMQHIADNIEFTISFRKLSYDAEELFYDAEELFPLKNSLAQKELIDSGKRGLYNVVQRDSDVEERFIKRLCNDEDNVILYFKFPPKFKINFPKIIGNYNPDWGIVRRDRNGNHTLQLVRETKGTTNLDNLRFVKEPLKIKCAEKHFKAIGIDYRVIDGTENNWWTSANTTVNEQETIF
jgi:type III restriction enzyme